MSTSRRPTGSPRKGGPSSFGRGAHAGRRPYAKPDRSEGLRDKRGTSESVDGKRDVKASKPGFREKRLDFNGSRPDSREKRPDFKEGRPSFGRGKPDFKKGKPDFKKGRPEFKKRDHTSAADVGTPPARERSDTVLIWGLHAARAAWLNPKRRIFRLWLSEAGQNTFEKSIVEARDELLLKRPDAKRVDRSELDRLTPPATVHQGIILEASMLHEPPLHEIIGGDNPPDLLLMLDQVTDPHNVGAIMRSAAAFGAGAVILTERNAPSTTGVLAKSASGALEHVPQIHVVNLARALDELRDAGYWSVGLAEEGEKDLSSLDLTGRTVLVMGAEGDGLRQLTRKKCDELARLPTGGPVGSLNVSNAAVVGLYEIRRQKKTAG